MVPEALRSISIPFDNLVATSGYPNTPKNLRKLYNVPPTPKAAAGKGAAKGTLAAVTAVDNLDPGIPMLPYVSE